MTLFEPLTVGQGWSGGSDGGPARLPGRPGTRTSRQSASPGIPWTGKRRIQDLYISGGHALYLDGALIEARYLVNDRSIAPAAPDADTILQHRNDTHDVIFAEGATRRDVPDGERQSRTLFELCRTRATHALGFPGGDGLVRTPA